INFPLIVLNGFVCVTGILFSWNIEERVKEFFAFFLTLIGGVYGVFMAMDLFLLFVFYELAIIPKYFIIAIWGSTRKQYGAMLVAGVVMTLGSYGCFRAGMLLMPEGLIFWKWTIAVLAVIGIVYGAGVALVQKEFKFIIGYSSVSHMGFVLLGLATLNVIGM